MATDAGTPHGNKDPEFLSAGISHELREVEVHPTEGVRDGCGSGRGRRMKLVQVELLRGGVDVCWMPW